jgi:hypothetical protein
MNEMWGKKLLDPLYSITAGVRRMKCGVKCFVTPAMGLNKFLTSIL